MEIDTIIFDLGNVLIDWNPRYLYRKMFATEAEVDYLMNHVTTLTWNEEQDAGRSLAEGTEWLVARHPEHEEAIRAYYGRWVETLGGAIEGSVEILRELKERGDYRLYALTNWSAELFPIALERFEFLHWFDGRLVSGEEKIRKPDPRFFDLLRSRFDVDFLRAVFIDDNYRNVEAALAEGLDTIWFQHPQQLREELADRSVLD
jgi:2-haloacid dehalogenase